MFRFAIFVICFFLWLSHFSIADQIAIAEDGRKVLLRDDGTWKYVQEEVLPEKRFDFRKTRWGMNSKLVKKSESAS